MDTKELLNKLSQTNDIEAFLNAHQAEFHTLDGVTFLNEMAAEKELTVATVAKQSGQGEYVYKVFSGDRKPSREVLIGIAFGMQMTIEETQLLLRLFKMATLDPRNRRDSIILYSLKEKHTFEQTNDLLDELGEHTF